MRITSNKGDYGYQVFKFAMDCGKSIHIFLNGIEQKGVSVADEDGGYIIKDVLDKEGNCQVNPNKPDEVWVETLKGDVKIEIRGP